MKMYYQGSDGEYHELQSIGEVDLNCEPTEDELVRRFLGSESFEFEIPIESMECGGKNPQRVLASGFDRGRYNGLTLKEDGYLSPANAWMRGK